MLASAHAAGGQDPARNHGAKPATRARRAWPARWGSTCRRSTRFAPWFAAEAISQLQLAQLGFDAQSGVEMYFLGRARTDGKSVAGLETRARPDCAVRGHVDGRPGRIPDVEPGAGSRSAERSDDMVHAWQRGDTGWFETEIKSELGHDPAALSVARRGPQPQMDRANRGAARR